jgi:hypothetical protein
VGARYADWFGRYWKSWGDALREAGFEPNPMQTRGDDQHILGRYVALARELGRVPVKGDLIPKRRQDRAFPTHNVFGRFGTKAQLMARARAYCLSDDNLRAVADLFPEAAGGGEPEPSRAAPSSEPIGFVYLIRAGRFYKIGKTNSVGRRERNSRFSSLRRPAHEIRTDDPEGIEAYWHGRFASKRMHGEWFKLDAEDVVAFKRRKFQ